MYMLRYINTSGYCRAYIGAMEKNENKNEKNMETTVL